MSKRYEHGANEADECEALKAAIREIAAGFLPDGTYGGRPIYEIAPQCFESDIALPARRD